MKINTLLAIFLFAFSPFAMANHADTKSCKDNCCASHHTAAFGQDAHASMAGMKHEDGKSCKDACAKMSEKHDMKGMDMSGLDMKGMDHSAMGASCSDEKSCAKMCGDDAKQCDSKECAKCCGGEMESKHAGH